MKLRRFNMSILDVTGSRTAKGQTSANHMEALRISLNCVYSKMPHAITARRKVIYTQYVVIVKKSSPKNLSADCRSTVGQLSAVS